jgi:hypothetical protein
LGPKNIKGGLIVMADHHRTRPADPTAPATAEIIAFHRGSPVEDYDGTAGDIFRKSERGDTRSHRHRPTIGHRHRGAVSVMCLTLTNAAAGLDPGSMTISVNCRCLMSMPHPGGDRWGGTKGVFSRYGCSAPWNRRA